jgi:hypothetical protein
MFKFENFWTRLPRFQETVAEAWNAPNNHTEPFHILGHKLHQTAKALKSWSFLLLSQTRLRLHMAQEVILRLDEAQEFHRLSDAEFALRAKLKKCILGWLVVEKARKKQSARISYIREGDTNTHFFHLRANGRRRKNYIHRLRSGAGWVVDHNDKRNVVQDHFEHIMADPPPCSCDFNWPLLQWDSPDLSSLDRPFSEDEIWQAIRLMPQDTTSGPDGFTGLFLRKCWQTIRHNIIDAINSIYNLRCQDLTLINKANIILLPKKEGAEAITDYRPISLIHAVTKIITKVLALRLQPFMHRLISACQSAFIKKRSIHDNYLYVRNLTRRFHRTKTAALLFKLDISKAFDSVRWDHLITLLAHRGFPTRWINWITSLLSSSTSTVMLNGVPLRRFSMAEDFDRVTLCPPFSLF